MRSHLSLESYFHKYHSTRKQYQLELLGKNGLIFVLPVHDSATNVVVFCLHYAYRRTLARICRACLPVAGGMAISREKHLFFLTGEKIAMKNFIP